MSYSFCTEFVLFVLFLQSREMSCLEVKVDIEELKKLYTSEVTVSFSDCILYNPMYQVFYFFFADFSSCILEVHAKMFMHIPFSFEWGACVCIYFLMGCPYRIQMDVTLLKMYFFA